MKIAVLDDYQNVAFELADWSTIRRDADVVVFNDHVSDPKQLVERLKPFDVVCVMRERTPLSADTIMQLENLKLIVSTGSRNASIDVDQAERQKIEIANTGYFATPTVELTWALILGVARQIASEAASVRSGGWQTTVGADLAGRTLGVLGLGNIGARVAKIATAFDMNVIAWSENLTSERCEAAGAKLVSRKELFAMSDFLSVHLILSKRSRGIVGPDDLNRMKSTAFLINTSRGPLVDEAALVSALEDRKIAGAGLDVYDVEPLPANHAFRKLPNVLATPHIGYVGKSLYEVFYRDTVKAIESWMRRR